MAEIPAVFMPHRVDVEPLTGVGAHGDVFGPKVTNVPCMKDEKRRLIRNSDGDEVLSETTLLTRLSRAALFSPGSSVDLGSRVTTVISVSQRDDGGLGAWQHLEVNCE